MLATSKEVDDEMGEGWKKNAIYCGIFLALCLSLGLSKYFECRDSDGILFSSYIRILGRRRTLASVVLHQHRRFFCQAARHLQHARLRMDVPNFQWESASFNHFGSRHPRYRASA